MNQDIPNKYRFTSWIRIFGIGEESKDIIDQIKAENYPDVGAYYITNEIIFPEDDEMVIFINSSNKEINTLTKSFYKAGVLTLIISTHNINFERECYDSYTVISKDKIFPAIKSLFDPLFHINSISFGFNDILFTLKDSGNFIITSYESTSLNNRMKEMLHNLKNKIQSYQGIENLAFVISYDPSSELHLSGRDLETLQDYLNDLHDEVNVVWGLQRDEDYKDKIKITAIASGHNLYV